MNTSTHRNHVLRLLSLLLITFALLLSGCGGGGEEASGGDGAAQSEAISGPLKFIYFRSDDCGTQCTEMDPIIEGFATKYKDKLIVDTQDGASEAGKKLMEQFNLTKIPSYVVLDAADGKLWSNSGPIHKDMLAQQLIALVK